MSRAGNSPAGSKPTGVMAFRDSWHRALVYFGIAEERDPYEDEYYDEDLETEAETEARYRERPNVRRLSPRRRRDEIDDIFADDPPRTGALRPVGGSGAVAAGRVANGRGDVRVHLVIPKSFNDAQDV